MKKLSNCRVLFADGARANLDIVMPEMGGYEVCRRLRQMPETAEVPIILLSSLEGVQQQNKTQN